MELTKHLNHIFCNNLKHLIILSSKMKDFLFSRSRLVTYEDVLSWMKLTTNRFCEVDYYRLTDVSILDGCSDISFVKHKQVTFDEIFLTFNARGWISGWLFGILFGSLKKIPMRICFREIIKSKFMQLFSPIQKKRKMNWCVKNIVELFVP